MTIDHGRWMLIRYLYALLGGLTLAAGGCVTPMTAFSLPHGEAENPPCRVVCYWDRNVRLAFDSINHGTPVPGLAGRVYFLGEDKLPITARGQITVEWYDPTATGEAANKPVAPPIVYRNEELQRMMKRDPLGVGYTLFLPWPDYRQNITRVRIHLCFVPEKGSFPLYADPTLVSLETDQPITSHQQVLPASGLLPGALKK